MPSLWLFFIINLSPLIRLASVAPALCQNHVPKSRQFVIQDNYSNDQGFQELHFNLNFSCVWSGTTRNTSPRMTKKMTPEKANIYTKTEEFISEITRLLPDGKLNVTSVVKHGLLEVKKQRKNQRLEKRLHIGIYHRHNINPIQETNFWPPNQLPIDTTNVSTDYTEVPILRNIITNLGIHDNQSHNDSHIDNCTHKSTESRKCVDEVITQFRYGAIHSINICLLTVCVQAFPYSSTIFDITSPFSFFWTWLSLNHWSCLKIESRDVPDIQ